MALFEGKTPAERNKMIAAIALPLLALIFVVRMLSGPSAPSGAANTNNRNSNRAAQRTTAAQRAAQQAGANAPAEEAEVAAADIMPIDCCASPYAGEGTGRNIFAFYVRPVAPAGPATAPPTPPPTPTPTPPITLATLAPQSVFAGTSGFTLQLSGDRFGPAARVYIEGQEVPTQYRSMQQISANVPASVIASPGQRSILVRTPDGRFYSNPATLNVMQAPKPTYTFVGFLKRRQGNTAVLKDARNELYSVRQGDIVEGRFRVAEISERGVDVVDKDLNIKHTLPYVDARGGPAAPGRVPGAIQPPPPPGDDGDEEP